MIKSFACKETARVFQGETSRKLPASIQRTAHKRLLMLNAAEAVQDLRTPPGNRLEALSGDRKGQYSLRINDQWRICFVWKDGEAHGVEIVDYH
jgi:proteic killer suppression protein